MGVAKRHRVRRIDENRPRMCTREGLVEPCVDLSLRREIDPRPRARRAFKHTFAAILSAPFLARNGSGRSLDRRYTTIVAFPGVDVIVPANRRRRRLKVRGRTDSRYIVEACAPAISRRGGVCRWKFYQYLDGSSSLALAVVREKLRAERRTAD